MEDKTMTANCPECDAEITMEKPMKGEIVTCPDWGIPSVNTAHVADVCGNKLVTSSALVRAGVPSTRVKIAFTPESALQAIEEIGYPVVLKPSIGSWGRLISKINDRDAAEAVLE